MNLKSKTINGVNYKIIYELNDWIVYHITRDKVNEEIFIVHTHPKSIPNNPKLTLDWIKDRTTCYCGTKMPKNIIVLKALYDKPTI